MLEDFHKVFIDAYLQTDSIEEAAKRAGIGHKEALSAGIDLMNNPEIQEALKKRALEFEQAYSVLPMTKSRVINIMMGQYEKAVKLGRIKDSNDILAKIAEASGINFKELTIEPITLVINNLNEEDI